MNSPDSYFQKARKSLRWRRRQATAPLSRAAFRLVSRTGKRLVRWWEHHQIEEIRALPNFQCPSDTLIEGVPVVRIHDDAKITIGNHVMLNSSATLWHVTPYGPVTLLAKRPGASITIGDQTRIHGSCILAYGSVSVGRRCLIAVNCQILDASGHALSFTDVEKRIDAIYDSWKPVVIHDDVWLCEGVKVLPGVTIGKGTVVGAGSVVTKHLPPYCLAAGNPARVVRQFDA